MLVLSIEKDGMKQYFTGKYCNHVGKKVAETTTWKKHMKKYSSIGNAQYGARSLVNNLGNGYIVRIENIKK